MGTESFEDVVQSTENLVSTFRNSDLEGGEVHWETLEEEYTHWIEEQRAWRETCLLMDQSYHLANYYIVGPDALRVNADLGLSGFDDFDQPPNARHHPVCNPDGNIIGEPILFQLDEETVAVVGNRGLAQKWIQYNVETGDYDASVETVYSPYGDRPPVDFRFEIQGPNARKVLEEVVDGSLPNISFFQIEEASIDGADVFILGHGMASAPGYEIFGSYDHHDEVKERFLQAGEDYGIRQLGAKAYKTATITTGWLPPGLPAVYDSEEMRGYREWLSADAVEANWSLGGSFESDDITDYYLNAVELGYENLIDFDHDFVGRDALKEEAEGPHREKVTFVWNDEDVIDVYASLFRDGETNKFAPLPDIAQQWDMGHYDEVRFEGDPIGISLFVGYDYNERSMLSLGVVDPEYAEPGTEVSVVWGENTEKEKIERHAITEIGATIMPAPYNTAREDI